MRTFTLLSTSDTDLLAARSSDSDWRLGNPYRVGDLVEFATGTDLVVVRILGSRRKYEDMVAPLLGLGVPVVVLGGEQLPDAELMGLSTVPMGVATDAHAYLAQGGPDNIVQLHRFLADTVLLDGEGFERPAVAPDWGLLDRPDAGHRAAGRRPVLPGAPPGREHRLRARAVQRGRDRRGRPGAGLLRVAAVGGTGDARRAAHRRRHGRHGARRRRVPARPPRRPAGTTAPGTSASSPGWTSR